MIYPAGMAIVECIYRYADGHEERDQPFEVHEHYGIGEVRAPTPLIEARLDGDSGRIRFQ